MHPNGDMVDLNHHGPTMAQHLLFSLAGRAFDA